MFTIEFAWCTQPRLFAERVIESAHHETLTHAFDRGHAGVKDLADGLDAEAEVLGLGNGGNTDKFVTLKNHPATLKPPPNALSG